MNPLNTLNPATTVENAVYVLRMLQELMTGHDGEALTDEAKVGIFHTLDWLAFALQSVVDEIAKADKR